MKQIIDVKPLKNYRVYIKFKDGKEGIVSLADLVGKGIFKKWQKHPEEFSKVKVNPQTHTLTWPDGIDICPDSLYEDIVQVTRKAS